ncbi:unnamed protein product [Closterium sp. NIES-65]|nr:unnamed protein product [Closterium sp. NIES-65]
MSGTYVTCQVKRLSGVVDDCCCEYETVDELNSHVLQPLLTQLVNTTFFKYFKVRLWCDCPFWPDDGMCHSRDCSVGECKDDEVPPALRCPSPPAPSLLPADVDEPRDADLDPSADESASAESAAGSVDRTVDRSAFQAWVEADNPWTSDDESDTASQVYVNLALNPERYTGYGGDSARRIWQAIYQESCFQDGTRDECTERRVLYRLISGLHQAISVHVAASQIWDSAAGKWGPNITIFHHRVAKFPERLANLYFTFLFVLRAATKAADFLSRASYDTGNPLEDQQTAALVQQVVRNGRLQAACPLPFDEARMWRGDEGPMLKQTLQGHFRNISLIMDCVGCERCRLWGKLEILGLATALKILFSVDGNGNGIGNGIGGNGNGNGVDKLSLQRNEVVALFNTLWRFSHALKTTAELVTLLEMNPSPDAPVIGAAPIASVSGGPAAAGSGGGGGGGDSGSGVGGAADTVPLQKTSLSIIDTCEFQRLRHIRQLGVCHYVYPSANHTRLEHSIGTSHLANEVVESLRRQQPELRINDDDVMAVTLAGLCHDMGHGCFSHMLDNSIFSHFCSGSDWHHEKRSVELVDRVIDNNNIDIDPDTVATIKDYKEKEFLWDIVANARTGIDVDKFDYLARDSYFCNIKSCFDHKRFDYLARDSYFCNIKACFDHKRIIQMMRVIDDEICFKYRELETVNDLFWLRAKMLETVNELFWLRAKMYRNVYAHKTTVNELFWLRAKMYRNVYTHKTVKAVEAMILEALTHASHVFRFEEIALTKDLDRFCQLDDTILREILRSRDPSLAKSQEILRQLERRQLYQHSPSSLNNVCSLLTASCPQITPPSHLYPVSPPFNPAVHERGRGPIGRSSPLQEALVCLPALCLLLFDLLPSPPSPPPSPHSVCSCLTSSLRPLPLLPPLQYMNEFVVPVDALHHFRKLTVDELLQHNLTVDALAEHGTGSYLREHGDQVIVDNIKIDYGQDTDNPLDKVRFFDVSRGGCTSGSPSA